MSKFIKALNSFTDEFGLVLMVLLASFTIVYPYTVGLTSDREFQISATIVVFYFFYKFIRKILN